MGGLIDPAPVGLLVFLVAGEGHVEGDQLGAMKTPRERRLHRKADVDVLKCPLDMKRQTGDSRATKSEAPRERAVTRDRGHKKVKGF